MLQYLFRLTAGKQEHEPGEKDLKVQDINKKLDELAAAGSAEEKTAVLQWLVQRSSARMLKWITQIILKDLKVRATYSEPALLILYEGMQNMNHQPANSFTVVSILSSVHLGISGNSC